MESTKTHLKNIIFSADEYEKTKLRFNKPQRHYFIKPDKKTHFMNQDKMT